MIEIIKTLEGRIAALERASKNVIRVGIVVERRVQGCKVRVQFPDNDMQVSYWCLVLQHKAHRDQMFWLPDLGELVVCLFQGHAHEQGFVLGAIYSQQDLIPPAATLDRLVVRDSGGNEMLMDRRIRKIRITTTELHLFGNLVVHGEVYDVLGTLTHHTNRGLPRDPGSGPPEWNGDD